MESFNIKINYLYHSGFSVETKNYFLVFDYYKDFVESGIKSIENGAVGNGNLKINKHIIVFSSHSHGDHYNPAILDWSKIRPDIKYVFSSDISIESGIKQEIKNINQISAYQEINIEDAYIKAYGSTDIGVSFLVKVDGVTIFHAGDLNWWYWWDDTKKEIEKAERLYKQEIEKIKREKIDIAFFPVDQRLEHNYSKGAEYFIEELNPSIFVPMHFGDNYETSLKFAEEKKQLNTKIVKITHRGQEILV